MHLFLRAFVLILIMAQVCRAQGPGLVPQIPPHTAAVVPAAPAVSARGEGETPALTRQDAEAWLDGYVPYALQRADVAGAVVVVVKDGQVLLQKGYGDADPAAHKAVDPENTLFRLGSVSKLFTWTAVMQQVEQGKLDLDRDINTYLNFTIPPYAGKPVTLRNLMTHTGGFQETTKQLIYAEPAAEPGLQAYLEHNMPDRIFPPGTTPSYSNYGATLAGYIVQRVSGEAFDDYVEKHIFVPLGMQHASFRQPLPAALQPLMSQGFSQADEPPKAFEVVGPAPAGSASMSGADVAKFMIAHLQDGEYNGQRILQQATAQTMHTTALNNIPPLNSMLLGFYQMNRNGHRMIGHAGDTQWFHAEMTLFLDDHVGLFIGMNSLGADAAAGPIRIGLRQGFADRYFPAATPAAATPDKAAVANAAALAGTYITSRREETNFFSLLYYLLSATPVETREHGGIVSSGLKDLAGQPERFDPIGPYVWRATGGKTRLAARLDGQSVAAWTDDESPYEVYTRVPWYKDATWLRPALIVAVAALLLTAVFWPVTALYRRRYGAVISLRGTAVASYRLTRVACLLDAVLMIAWPATILYMLQTFALNGTLDPWLLALHWLTIVIFPLSLLIFIGNAIVVWTSRAGFAGVFARVWSVVLALSGAVLLWTGYVFHLIGTGMNY